MELVNEKEMTEIQKLESKLALLKAKQVERAQKIENDRRATLLALPETVGLSSVEDLIKALKGLNKSPTAGNRGSRIPVESRTGIETALREGSLSGKEIAAKYSVSLPTVQNIKKALGLVATRTVAV